MNSKQTLFQHLHTARPPRLCTFQPTAELFSGCRDLALIFTVLGKL